VLVALVDEREDLHAKAVRDLQLPRKQPLALTSLVLGEACFLLPHAYQRRRLLFLLTGLAVAELELEPPWRDEVFAWLDKYQEHEPDLADAQLAVLCSRHAQARVWSYDVEFQTTWRRTDGRRIPLFGRPATRTSRGR
jgi:predicted nucleic acid-binding protein